MGSNCLQEKRNDEVDGGPTLQVEQVKVPLDPMMLAQAKRINDSLQLVKAVQANVGVPKAIEGLDSEGSIVNVIVVMNRAEKPHCR